MCLNMLKQPFLRNNSFMSLTLIKQTTVCFIKRILGRTFLCYNRGNHPQEFCSLKIWSIFCLLVSGGHFFVCLFVSISKK